MIYAALQLLSTNLPTELPQICQPEHRRSARNSRISDSQATPSRIPGFTRALGEGIDVTFKNMESAQEFVTTIRRRESNQVERLSSEKSNQVDDLDTGLRYSDTFETDSDTDFRYSDTFETDSDTFRKNSDTRRSRITKKQKDIINFCSVPRTSREILDRAGVVYHTKNIARYITSLVESGYLEMTNPDNPKASNQKYRRRLNLGRK